MLQTLSPFLMAEVSRELQSATCKVEFTHPAGLSSASLRLVLNFLSFFYQEHRCVKWKSNTKCSKKTHKSKSYTSYGIQTLKSNRGLKIVICAFCWGGRVSLIPIKIGTVCFFFSPTNLICFPHPSPPPGSLSSFKVTMKVSPLSVQSSWHSSLTESIKGFCRHCRQIQNRLCSSDQSTEKKPYGIYASQEPKFMLLRNLSFTFSVWAVLEVPI